LILHTLHVSKLIVFR